MPRSPAFLIAAAFFSVGGPFSARAAEPVVFPPGAIFIDHHGSTVQVLGCKGTGYQGRCQVRVLAQKGSMTYGDTWWDLDLLRGTEQAWIKGGGAPYAGPAVNLPGDNGSVARPAQHAPTGDAKQAPATPVAVAAPARPDPLAAPRPVAGCPVPPPAISNTAPFSEAVFRRKAYDTYARSVNGTMTAPLAVGVTFESVKLGAPVTNTVTIEPGRGAQRFNDAAPPYIKLYPVTSTHVVCEQYRGSVSHRRVESVEHCFISRDSEWLCGVAGPLKITKID